MLLVRLFVSRFSIENYVLQFFRKLKEIKEIFILYLYKASDKINNKNLQNIKTSKIENRTFSLCNYISCLIIICIYFSSVCILFSSVCRRRGDFSRRKKRWRIAQKSRSMTHVEAKDIGRVVDLGLRYSGKIAVTGGWANGSRRSISIPVITLPRIFHTIRFYRVESINSTIPSSVICKLLLASHYIAQYIEFDSDTRITWFTDIIEL